MKIYTTGAFLVPLKYKSDDGSEKIVWKVTKFIEDSYDENGNLCYPDTISEKEEGIFNNTIEREIR